MSIEISKAVLEAAFGEKDAARYAGELGSGKKDLYLTDGPGKYCLEVLEYKAGTNVSETAGARFGQSYVVTKFKVVKADPVKDQDGESHAPQYEAGDEVTTVSYLSSKARVREVGEITGAIMGLPPAIRIKEGPHKNALLTLVGVEQIESCAKDDGELVAGRTICVNVVPRLVEKGAHAGKTFHNLRDISPADESHEPVAFLTWDELKDTHKLLDRAAKKYGK